MLEFVIPLVREDLRKRTDVNQYVVEEVHSHRVLPAKMQEWRHAYRSGGPLVVIHHFDTLYSVLMNAKSVDEGTKKEAWDSVLRALTSEVDQLRTILEPDIVDKDTRVHHVTVVKMLVYLLTQLTDQLYQQHTDKVLDSAKGRSKSNKEHSHDQECERVVLVVLKLMELPVFKLWDPPVLEEEFINLVTNLCYKMLESSGINRNKSCRDACVHVIGIMIRRYNHSLAASLKLLQLVQNHEHLAAPLAQAVSVFATEYETKSIVGDIVREISRMDFAESRDTSGTHHVAVFLSDMAERCAPILLQHMARLTPLLDEECYQMRNCVLTVMGEILVQVLGSDNLDTRQKQTRDSYLDHFEDHLHDVNAFVRSKTLQIWLHMINEKVVPLGRRHELLELVLGRLQDVSCQVRKHAVQVVSALVKSDPFAAKLSYEELEVNYHRELDKLTEMTPDSPQDDPVSDVDASVFAERWSGMEKKIREAIEAVVEHEQHVDNDLVEDNETLNTLLCRIVDLLMNGDLTTAVCLLRTTLDLHPELAALHQYRDDHLSQDSMSDGESCSSTLLRTMKAVFIDVQSGRLTGDEVGHGSQPISEEMAKQKVLVQYLKDSVAFVGQIQRATVLISQLLGSKSTSDVLESVEFFVTCYEFGLPSVHSGIRAMLNLVWSKESSVKEAVVRAYKRLYVDPRADNPRSRALTVVKNLSNLLVDATKGHLTSMEELVCELVRSGDLSSGMIQMMWEIFTRKLPNTDADQSRLALILLSMVASAEESVARTNISVVVKEGLGERAEGDLALAKDACVLLMKIGPTKTKGQNSEQFRLPKDHDIFPRLSTLLVKGFVDCSSGWIPFMEQSVGVIYKLAEHPDLICTDIIRKLIHSAIPETPTAGSDVFSDLRENVEPDVNATSTDDVTDDVTQKTADAIPTAQLSFLLSISGHVAMKQLVFLDVDVFGEMKRRHQVMENKEEQKKKSSDSNKRRRSAAASKSREPEQEDDMGLGDAPTEDLEAEFIRKVCEEEIVTGNNLLSSLSHLIVAVCQNPGRYKDTQLQTAAALALAKYMLVSSVFCEQHLPLLFTIMERSDSAVIRANCVVALGDLTFRYPNLIEPWTPRLYASLRDQATQVRRNTVMVLTHLILNDMVKVKGQISEMAVCILDQDQRIANLTKLFFNELSAKGNNMYNIMPDAISRLSDPERGVDEDHFREILRFLLSFIQKDRHCEGLVEKLCHRFQAARSDRQSRDLAFCLSLLQYSERSLRKLLENIGLFGDKLGDQDVYKSFATILANGRKHAKVEAKNIVEELEARIEELHHKGATEEEIAANAKKASQAAKTFRRGRGRGGRSPKKTIRVEPQEHTSPLVEVARTKRNTRATKQALNFSDSESDYESPPHKHKTPAARRKKAAALDFSDSE